MNARPISRPTPAVRTLGAAALLALAGCATPGDPTATTTAPAAAGSGYVWHDPRFYDPWLDPEAVVLPPPPFTGFDSGGKTSPMLPTRPRPATSP